MKSDLKRKTVQGVKWSAFENFGSTIISFVFGILLARILSPSDYGLTAMIAIFLGISRIFIESGFSNALIRKPDLKDEDCSTAFYFNLLIAVGCYLILFFTAPLIAKFYNKDILCSIVRAEAVCLIINSLVLVQIALANRRIDFKLTSKVNLSSSIVSGFFGILLALKGFGVWSLVFMDISNSLVALILYWYNTKWIPKFVFSKRSFKYLFGFGSKLLATGILDVIFQNLYPIVIGKYYTPTSLGYYTKAMNFAKLPSSLFTKVIQRVTFPVLSTIQQDNERLAFDYRRLLRMSAFIIFPLMVGIAAIAKPLISLLLTNKWEQSAIYLQLLCFAMMLYPIHSLNLNLLQVKGRTDLFLKTEVIKKIIEILIIICSVRYGITIMCVGLIANSFIALVINTYYTGVLIKIGFWIQFKDLYLIFLNSIVMGGFAYYISSLFNTNILSIVGAVISGFASYILFSYICKLEELKELTAFVKKRKF